MSEVKQIRVDPEISEAFGKISEARGGVEGIEFTKVESFTGFSAEYAIVDSDLVFHFFLPPELIGRAKEPSVVRYWTEIFPQVLEPIATNTFKAGPPRLIATFVSDYDLNSWWFKAYGFGDVLDPDALCNKFMSGMDQALDDAVGPASSRATKTT